MSLLHKLRTLGEIARAPLRTQHETVALHATLRQLTELTARSCEVSLRQGLPSGHLARHGYSVYSQNDEDGMLAELFRRIGTTNRSFVEIGTGDGLQNNTTHLLLQGWSGHWFEIDDSACRRAQQHFARYIAAGRLACVCAGVTAMNVETLLGQAAVPAEPDLLSIDIDGNDYWVWQAIQRTRPRAVVIEYNAAFGPDLDWVMAHGPAARWDGTRNQGASLAALTRLGESKGYRLAGCNLHGINAFFVRTDCLGTTFSGPGDARTHFLPPLYSQPDYRWPGLRGHRPTPAEIPPPPASA